VEQTSPLCSSRRDGQKIYMERLIWSLDEEVMPSRRCSAIGSSDKRREFRPESEVLTRVRSSDPHREFQQTLGVPTRVVTSDSTSDRPNNCSDLAFEILIRTVPNLWETLKIDLERFSTGLRPSPLYI
jgi:hypothetical protein